MTRDIVDRLRLFSELADKSIRLERLALNWDQIEEFKPPPNPAKTTDARFRGYQKRYGDESWELDALDPQSIVGMIRVNVESLIDRPRWERSFAAEMKQREAIQAAADDWDRVSKLIVDC